jgi:hypothetical protein
MRHAFNSSGDVVGGVLVVLVGAGSTGAQPINRPAAAIPAPRIGSRPTALPLSVVLPRVTQSKTQAGAEPQPALPQTARTAAFARWLSGADVMGGT